MITTRRVMDRAMLWGTVLIIALVIILVIAGWLVVSWLWGLFEPSILVMANKADAFLEGREILFVITVAVAVALKNILRRRK